MRLVELQHAAVFAQFGDQSQITEQQPVCSLLLLLLLDLKDGHSYKKMLSFTLHFKLVAQDAGNNFDIYVFVVVGVDRPLQQRQQVVQAPSELLLLHLHKQTTNLSTETPQAGLRGQE